MSGCRDARVSADPPTAPEWKLVVAPPTTDGRIATRNLESRVGALEKQYNASRDPAAGARLVDHLLMRARFLGKLADYGRALRLADALVKDHPESAHAYEARGTVRARLHRFAEALADLDRAEELGRSPGALAAARAEIALATGDTARARQTCGRRCEEEVTALVAGAVATDAGVAALERMLRDPVRVSAFATAWTYMQVGLLWEKREQVARARAAFEAALERLPTYAEAAAHVAEYEAAAGETARAIERLENLVERSDNPEYRAMLAALLRERDGANAAADRHLAAARRGYRALAREFPGAFDDHAARFWLGIGRDYQTALALATRNRALRDTESARALEARARDLLAQNEVRQEPPRASR